MTLEEKFGKYTMPVTPTTPSIEKVSNPCGRSGDCIEWVVTGTTSASKRTFTRFKDAFAYFEQVMTTGEKQ